MSKPETITFEALQKRNVELEGENYELHLQLQPEREQSDRPDTISILKDQLAAERVKVEKLEEANGNLRGRIFSFECVECGGQTHHDMPKNFYCCCCGKPMARKALVDTEGK